MKINAINEYRVEVELDAAEMERLGVSFDTLDWADIETRRALWSLLGQVRDAGVPVNPAGKLLIEACRLKNGIRLCFTALPPREKDLPLTCLKREESVSALRFASFADLKRGAAFLPREGLAAYRRGDTYYLLAPEPADRAALARAAEFGVPVKAAGLTKPLLEEYCIPVAL